MSKIKKKNFIFVSLLLAVICGLAYCLPSFINSRQISQTTSAIRTIEVKQNEIDYQSIFDEFENAKLETDEDIEQYLNDIRNKIKKLKQTCDILELKWGRVYG